METWKPWKRVELPRNLIGRKGGNVECLKEVDWWEDSGKNLR